MTGLTCMVLLSSDSTHSHNIKGGLISKGIFNLVPIVSGVLLRCQILKRQLLRQMLVRKLLISCSFDEIMMQILMKSFDVVLRNGILLPKLF